MPKQKRKAVAPPRPQSEEESDSEQEFIVEKVLGVKGKGVRKALRTFGLACRVKNGL